jgi:hypothetical protein
VAQKSTTHIPSFVSSANVRSVVSAVVMEISLAQ